jgi:hypothetical protein
MFPHQTFDLLIYLLKICPLLLLQEILISITVTLPERSTVSCTRMLSFMCQGVISLIVCQPIQSPGVFVYVTVLKFALVAVIIFEVVRFTSRTPFSLLIL